MESNTYTIKIELKEGWEEELNRISKLQAAREKPRKVISVFPLDKYIVVIYELM